MSVKDQRLPSFNSIAPINRMVIYKEFEFTDYDKPYQEHLLEIIESIDLIYRESIKEYQERDNA